MYSFGFAAGLLASATLSLAAPATLVANDTILINQIATGKGSKSGVLSLLHTYHKYGKEAPDHVRSAAAAVQSGEVADTPERYDNAFLCPVTVGDDTLMLDFDTGSSDLWVFSTLTPAKEAKNHTVYNPDTGKKLAGYTWKIHYGDGSNAEGVVYADKAVVGSVTATSQAVEAATAVSAEFVRSKASDGLLGLGFPKINTVKPVKQKTFYGSVSKTLANKLFTANLLHDEPGYYTFGYIDTSAYTGSISYVDVDNSDGYWGFTAGTYSIGTGASSSATIGSAIADTGTTLIYLPAAAVKAYYAQVATAKYSAAQGGWVFPCTATLPAFNVEIGGQTFTVPGEYVNYAPVKRGSATCYGGIQSNAGLGLTIFGDVFLKSVYAIFSTEGSAPQLGFASKTLST